MKKSVRYVGLLFGLFLMPACKKCGHCRLPNGQENQKECLSKDDYEAAQYTCELGSGLWVID